MQLSERIQKVIAEQQIDQPTLAKVAGVTKATVNQWILGKIKSIKMEYAVRIQERFGYSTSWLVMGSGPEKIKDWPFPGVDRRAYESLPAAMKAEIEHHMQFVIHRWQTEQAQQIHTAA